MAVTSLTHLILTAGPLFDAEQWTVLTDVLEDVFQASMPRELLDTSLISPTLLASARAAAAAQTASAVAAAGAMGATNFSQAMAEAVNTEGDIGEGTPGAAHSPLTDARRRAVVLLLLVQMVGDIVAQLYERLDTRNLAIIMDCLEGAANFAKEFNSNAELRAELVRSGLVPRLPTLRKLETEAYLAYASVLLRMYTETGIDGAARRIAVRDRFVECVFSLSHLG